ncbi:MAG: 16S rRNA (cytosine967-C5)-methyltransferase [Woeseiaceae bacterium]|jgi:16S rRNA (cytosine967-C5)-methyltransferase
MTDAKSGARLRAEAARLTDAVVTGGRSLDAVLAELDERIKVDDRPLVRMLCYGVLRNHYRLREQLRALLDRPLKARDSVIESLLVIGFYQLSDTRVPDHAAVSMTVEAARILRRPKFAGLINAVLRNFVRQKIADGEAASDESRFNHPQWLIAQIRQDWPQHWQQILAANNDRAPMWLRVNKRSISPDDYVVQHELAGERLSGFEQALRLTAPLPVDTLPGFADGVVSVQDAAAQIAAPWLLQHGGGDILDACAAPGGKSGHLLELMPQDSALTAIDQDADRLRSVHENLDRLGLAATVMTADASNPKEWCEGRRYDRILLDAPCSASGVIRRHPDIKLNRRKADIGALAKRQSTMLQALWTILKPGGRLLYVTCSVLAEENDAVIGDFLAKNKDASEERLLQNNNIRDLMIEKPQGFQVLPGTAGLDGFYFACLDKAS